MERDFSVGSTEGSGAVVDATLQGPVRWSARAMAGATAGIFVPLCFVRFGFTAHGAIAALFVAVLIVVSTIDVERRIIPNRIVLPAAAMTLAAQVAFFPQHALEWVLCSLGAALFLFLPTLYRSGAVGMGDVKLGLLLGAALGWHVFVGMTFGFFALWPFALFLFLTRGAASARKTTLPLGPFLSAGAIAALFLY
jgi:Flp pilus assembly protein protease CpaA